MAGRGKTPTPLRCSVRGRAAKLAALTAFAPLKHSRRVRGTKRAARAAPGPALLVATYSLPAGHRLPLGKNTIHVAVDGARIRCCCSTCHVRDSSLRSE